MKHIVKCGKYGALDEKMSELNGACSIAMLAHAHGYSTYLDPRGPSRLVGIYPII